MSIASLSPQGSDALSASCRPPDIDNSILLRDLLVRTTECERESVLHCNIETDEFVRG